MEGERVGERGRERERGGERGREIVRERKMEREIYNKPSPSIADSMSTTTAASPGHTKEDAQEEALKQMRARRADEWERVRNPDVPTEQDKEDDFETRTLYERLKENRELKRQEIEEQFRYKNMVYSGLDTDEHQFLETWEETKKKEHSEQRKHEIEELQKFKARMVDLNAESTHSVAMAAPAPPAKKTMTRQKQLLVGVVKKRKIVEKEETPAPLTGLGAYSDSSSSEDEEKKKVNEKRKSDTESESDSNSDNEIDNRKRKSSWDDR
eukprot:sb/3468230/